MQTDKETKTTDAFLWAFLLLSILQTFKICLFYLKHPDTNTLQFLLILLQLILCVIKHHTEITHQCTTSLQ